MKLTATRLIAALLGLFAAGSAAAQTAPALNEPPVRRPSAEPTQRLASTLPVAPGFAVNLSAREESRVFFNSVYRASMGVPIGWTGHTAQGLPGTTSAAFRDAVAVRVNYFRAMAGVPSGVAFSDILNGKDQRAALMMSANNRLNHEPPPAWQFYTAAGAEAARNSNLALGSFGPAAIDSYMEDHGAINFAAGHRRWLLYPQTTTMGTGDVPRSGSYLPANALWVIDPNFGQTRPATREEFVAWPPPGYVPHPLVFPRWSFSYPGADFSSATVAMSRNGSPIPVAVSGAHEGYGENTLVWVPNGADPNNAFRSEPPAQDTAMAVSIQNVRINGSARSFDYVVRVFDPAMPGPDTVIPAISGPGNAFVNVEQSYTFNGVPRATGYQWQQSTLVAHTAVEGAETGFNNVTVDVPAGYDVVSATVRATGARAFHFTHPDFEAQSLTIAFPVLPRAGSAVLFKSRLRWAAGAQTAHVQVSANDGGTWETLWSQSGTDSAGESAFQSRSVPLDAYAGRMIRVRFLYEYAFGPPAYTQTGDQFGWFVDDISFTATDKWTPSQISPTQQALGFAFTPLQASAYGLQVRPVFYGSFPGEWGPLRQVNASHAPASYPTITKQPASATAAIGSTARLYVEASGSGPLAYQWRKNGEPISGATSAELIIAPVRTADAGNYSVAVSTNGQAVVSQITLLRVVPPSPAGAYLGTAAATPPTRASTGTVRVNVLANGRFTGVIRLAGVPHAVTGRFDAAGLARFGAGVPQLVIPRRAPQLPLRVSMRIDPVEGKITGSIVCGRMFTSKIDLTRQ